MVTSALVLMPCGMLKEVLEKRSKQGAAFRHEVSGGEGDFVGFGEVKGTFASEDIRRKKGALANVGDMDMDMELSLIHI